MKLRIIAAFLVVVAGQSCSGGAAKAGISASGTIEAREVNIASKVSGELVRLTVDEGVRIRPGDLIAVMDHEAFEIQYRQAEAGARLARAQLDLLRKGARNEDIQQAVEGKNQAEAELKVAKDDVRRMRELARTGSVTPKVREDAEARYSVAQARFNAATEAVNKIRTFARPEELEAAEARLAQAEAGADLLRKAIADCTITSPVEGIVTHRAAEPGEIITSGATILTISVLERVSVMLYVTEKEMGRIKLGDSADVRIDAFPDRSFPGEVTYISPEAEFTPKNVQTKEDRVKLVFGVKIEIDNPEGLLKPGLPADAHIRIDSLSKDQ